MILTSEFKMSDLGPLAFFLGVQIRRNLDGNIFIGQVHYVKQVLEKFSMTNCNPLSTSITVGYGDTECTVSDT